MARKIFFEMSNTLADDLALLLGTSSSQPTKITTSSPDNSDAGRILESKGYRTENQLLETSDGWQS